MTRTLIVSSSIEELEKASLWLTKYLPITVSEEKKDHILLVIQEMVSNAIIHGNDNIKSKDVSLCLTIKDRSIVFTIEDEGAGLSSLPTKEEAKEMDYLAENGRGLKLAVLLSDDIQIKGNKVTLVFKI